MIHVRPTEMNLKYIYSHSILIPETFYSPDVAKDRPGLLPEGRQLRFRLSLTRDSFGVNSTRRNLNLSRSSVACNGNDVLRCGPQQYIQYDNPHTREKEREGKRE